jgi:predicted ATPase
MKIKKIIIENIRCFKNLEIDLTNNDGVVDWAVFLGNNGVGKTTLMRSIALCLCEESGAAGLLDELHGDWIRKEAPDKKAKIRIEFEKLKDYSKTPFIETIIKLSNFGEVEVSQTVEPKGPKIWNELFVCAYGANRRSYGTVSYSEYTVVDAVYSLFNYESVLQNVELNIRRLQQEIDIKILFKKLEDILLLEENCIKLERNGISIKGPWGSYIPMGAISDGYSATIAWIMDMYGWKMLYEEKMKDVEINGIVFLDEIEQHLHPLWQKEIINRLSRQFKNVQFFISTHSPIVAINALKTKHDDPNSKLYHIDWNNEKEANSSISEVQEPINELEYNQLLESEAFGHIINTNSKVDKLLKEMSELASIDKPTKKQKLILDTIKKELKPLMFPEGKTLIEREVERDYYQELEAKADYLQNILSKKND